MVSMMASGFKGPGLSPDGSLCCVLGQDTLLSHCLSLGGYLQLTSILPRGSSNTPTETGISSGSQEPLSSLDLGPIYKYQYPSIRVTLALKHFLFFFIVSNVFTRQLGLPWC